MTLRDNLAKAKAAVYALINTSTGSNALKVMAITVAGALLVFLSQIVLARLAGVSEFGRFAVAISILMLGLVPAKQGLDNAVVRSMQSAFAVNAPQVARGALVYAFVAATTGTLVFIVLLYLVAGLGLDQVRLSNLVFYMSFCAVAICLSNVFAGGFKGLALPVWAVFPQSIVRPGGTIVAAFLLVAVINIDFGAEQALLVFGIGFLLAASLSFLRLLGERELLSSREATVYPRRELHSLGLTLLGVSAAILIMRQTDILMLGYLLDSSSAGMYSAAVRISDFAGFPLIALNTVVAPKIARWFAGATETPMQKIATYHARSALLTTGLISLTLAVFGKLVLSFFGVAFTAAYLPLLVLLIGQCLAAYSGCATELLTMTGHQGVAARLLWACVVLNVVLDYVLISSFGMIGASLGTALSIGVWTLSMSAAAAKKVRISSAAFALPRPEGSH